MNTRNTSLAAISAAVVCLATAACSSSSSNASPAAVTSPAATSASDSPAGLTTAQGLQICQDIQTWIPEANKQDMPRFTTTLQTDEADAQGTPLGDDM